MSEPRTEDPSAAPLVARAGGVAALRLMLEDFYRRVLDDRMIGFFFKGTDPERLVAKELELALRFLGADVRYTGVPLGAAHARHPIQGGQFMRRLQILKETLDEHGMPAEVREAFVSHTLALRPEITAYDAGRCDPPGTLG